MTLPKGIFITGTDTEVGKTTVTATLAALLRQKGLSVGVLKPVQSGAETNERGERYSQDAAFIAQMAKCHEPMEKMAPYLFTAPISPHNAAREEGVVIDPEKIVTTYEALTKKYTVVLVEGAGGLLTPLNDQMSIGDLARRLNVPTLVVASPFLGAINQTLLTLQGAESLGLDIIGFVFSQCRNEPYPDPDAPLIEKRTGVPCLGLLPYCGDMTDGEKLLSLFESSVDTDRLMANLTHSSSYADYAARDKKYVWHPFTQMQDWLAEEITIVSSGRGAEFTDIKGETCLDAFSSYWCNAHGHGEPRLAAALRKQMGKIAHSTFLGASNEPAIDLAEELVRITPNNLTKVFYSDNGSTAVEVGVKMAHQYWRHTKPQGRRTRFLALAEAYHGDTVGAMSVGGVDLYHKNYRSLLFDTDFVTPPYCYRCPLGKELSSCALACADIIDEKLRERPGEFAAMIIEPVVQGPGGIITQPEGYLTKVRRILSEHDVLMIADEVAVGFGRTGHMFAVDGERVRPDIMTLSKTITGGTMPFAATMTSQKIFDAFLGPYGAQKTFFHGHTYTANQLGAAVALENLKLYRERDIVGGVRVRAARLAEQLTRIADLPHVGDIRQAGLIVGVELVKNKNSTEAYDWSERVGMRVCQEMKRRGILIRPLGNTIVLWPIPVIPAAQLKRLTDTLYDCIGEVTG